MNDEKRAVKPADEGRRSSEELGLLPEHVPACSFAVFDEFGKGADDRVQDYAAACVAAERERCAKVCERLAGGYVGPANQRPLLKAANEIRGA